MFSFTLLYIHLPNKLVYIYFFLTKTNLKDSFCCAVLSPFEGTRNSYHTQTKRNRDKSYVSVYVSCASFMKEILAQFNLVN